MKKTFCLFLILVFSLKSSVARLIATAEVSIEDCYHFPYHELNSIHFDEKGDSMDLVSNVKLVSDPKYKIGIIPFGILKPSYILIDDLKPYSYGLYADVKLNEGFSFAMQGMFNLGEKSFIVGPGIKYYGKNRQAVGTYLQVDFLFLKGLIGDYFYNDDRFTEWITARRFSLAFMPSLGLEATVDKRVFLSISGGFGFEYWTRVYSPSPKKRRIESSTNEDVYFPYLLNMFIQFKLGVCL